jgi:hypothetical protein
MIIHIVVFSKFYGDNNEVTLKYTYVYIYIYIHPDNDNTAPMEIAS